MELPNAKKRKASSEPVHAMDQENPSYVLNLSYHQFAQNSICRANNDHE
jgi:hypothetical protein